jgi:PAS domain-containing protein
VLAERPSGRILGGNAHVEAMLCHPVLHSPHIHSYGEWVSFHADGRRVESHEYPLARIVLAGEENPSIEVLYQCGDGTRAWTRIMGRPVRNERGEVVGGVVALLDVDGERRAREALAAREATLRATIALAPLPVLLHAEDGEILQASEAWQEISGWRWSEDIPTIADWTERAYGERQGPVKAYIDTLYALDRRVDEGDYHIQTRQTAPASGPSAPRPSGATRAAAGSSSAWRSTSPTSAGRRRSGARRSGCCATWWTGPWTPSS